MAKYSTLTALFTAIANSLRGKTGGTGTIVADDFPTVIDGLSTDGITPTGTKTITANGSHDVTAFATAQVSVPTPAQLSVARTVTISADVAGANAITTILSADDFVKAHYADDTFYATMSLVTPIASETGAIHVIFQGNRNIGSSNVSRTGFVLKSTSASAVGFLNCTAAINGKGYNVHFRADSTGKLSLYIASGNTLKAGTYQLIMGVAE